MKISDKLTESERTRMKYLLKSVLNVDIQKIVDKTIRDMEYQTLYF
ncbi:MAG: hypothetical protein M1422_04335 [Candidatus Thermoplasmatota archaeon]|nr:hypothetical protein [Candidatus Sysuiplasma jiujiangense]MBX8641818.1 hypothetical protein [Candidatus Sysuiplasma jiujiangense]MCL4317482.1 hypothetical protein [Candidatus Thermoplasmatota archaeon]MCL5254042.1 hypothetical protein [Candidatus Thermoplasmatota archaeon]